MTRKFEAKYSLVSVALKAEGAREHDHKYIVGQFDRIEMAIFMAQAIVQKQWPLDQKDQPVKADEYNMPDIFYMVVEVGHEDKIDFEDGLEEWSRLVYTEI
jgi:hypothetical protein